MNQIAHDVDFQMQQANEASVLRLERLGTTSLSIQDDQADKQTLVLTSSDEYKELHQGYSERGRQLEDNKSAHITQMTSEVTTETVRDCVNSEEQILSSRQGARQAEETHLRVYECLCTRAPTRLTNAHDEGKKNMVKRSTAATPTKRERYGPNRVYLSPLGWITNSCSINSAETRLTRIFS